MNDLYTLRLTEAWLRSGEIDRALVSFYGKLAQGMTRDTYIGGEGSGLRPLDAGGRPFYLPPNSSANAFFLWTLRHMLVQDFDRDGDGRADDLILLPAAPRAWLKDGGRIAVERMPTMFGEISYEVVSDLAHQRISGRVQLPEGLSAPAAIRLRLPDGMELVDGPELLPLPAGRGTWEFSLPTRPRPK